MGRTKKQVEKEMEETLLEDENQEEFLMEKDEDDYLTENPPTLATGKVREESPQDNPPKDNPHEDLTKIIDPQMADILIRQTPTWKKQDQEIQELRQQVSDMSQQLSAAGDSLKQLVAYVQAANAGSGNGKTQQVVEAQTQTGHPVQPAQGGFAQAIVPTLEILVRAMEATKSVPPTEQNEGGNIIGAMKVVGQMMGIMTDMQGQMYRGLRELRESDRAELGYGVRRPVPTEERPSRRSPARSSQRSSHVFEN